MMRILVISAVVIIAVGWVVPSTVSAQTIRLKNGNSLEGEVEIIDGEQVAVDIPAVGKLIFPIEEVASIEALSVETNAEPASATPLPVSVRKELIAGDKLFKKELQKARREVDALKIKNISFQLYDNLGAIEGYVVFRDKDGNQCSTKGVIGIGKEVTKQKTETVIVSPTNSYERTVSVKVEQTVKYLSFQPDAFEEMTLQNKSVIYALPLKLDPDEIQKGDVVILEWRGFKEKKGVY